MSERKRTRIGVFLFPGAEELDWAGPWEVVAAWAQGWPDDGIEALTVGQQADVMECAKGLRVIPSHSWASVGKLDVLFYPGGRGVRAHLEDAEVLDWVRAQEASGTIMASVCTGAWVFARAGLLDGKPATTHRIGLDRLAELGTDIDVRSDVRFVDNGNILTAAGVTAGIDLALHLVARLHSPERAQEIEYYIQYEPGSAQ